MSTKIYYGFRSDIRKTSQCISYINKTLKEKYKERYLSIINYDDFSYENFLKASKDILDDCGFHIFFDASYSYYILYGLPKICDSIKPNKFLKEYSYWDNTDPPKKLSLKEWNQRKKNWNKVALKPYSQWSNKATHSVATDDLFVLYSEMCAKRNSKK